MSLTSKFAEEFSPTARQEGARIFESGRALVDAPEAQWIEATVRDGRSYCVQLTREKGAVRYACECARFNDSGEPCKHVWAALLAAEAEGFTHEWTTTRRLDLLPDDDFIDLVEEDDGPMGTRAFRAVQHAERNRNSRTKGRKVPDWHRSLAALQQAMQASENGPYQTWPPGREVVYIIDAPRTLEGKGLVLEVNYRERKKDGNWGKPKRLAIRSDEVPGLPDAQDREILSLLIGARSARDSYSSYYYGSYDSYGSTSTFRLGDAILKPLVARMCQTGRCGLRMDDESDARPVAWDDEGAWELWMVARKDEQGASYVLSAELRRGEQRMPLSEPALLVRGGLVFGDDRVAPMDDGGAFPWVVTFREKPQLVIPAADREELLRQVLTMPRLPRLELPEDLKVQEVTHTPIPRLHVRKPDRTYYYDNKRLTGELSFDYDGVIVGHHDVGRAIYQPDHRRLILRDHEFERAAAARIHAMGFRRRSGYHDESPSFEVHVNNLPTVIRKLTAENWHIEADGQLYRQPGEVHIEVTSGIDWFELHGAADFGGQQVKLPELLAALRRGERTVRLDDGTLGVLPEQWLQKYGLLADMGTAADDHIRFGKTQIGLLDALLASQPQATCDAVFEQARQRMRSFEGVRSADAPAGFVGTLRPYQREGLGWMQFLRDFSFGGCLADDMGLGKTVQVLAVLEGRRELHTGGNGEGTGPSLVVAPRSLIFNWKEEAAKFAPNLRVLDHTGIGRGKSADAFGGYDVVLTTYGTVRNDATFLKDVRFDYVILDEAQAIKNASSESAKAARLLQGNHRLALSGTPVQNHLGELWSLFEFLNPGMLGTARAFQATGAVSRSVDEQTRQLLSRALRPFILRRTKQQVAKDLPLRVEQTIHCELDAAQRKLYDELREHYRQSLLSRIAREGINRAKIQILEALLRLRQAACHPGLIDKSKTGLGSAKLDSLLAQLAEVMDEGHKALVFSQFTSLLAIVRDRLDKEKVRYEYLDGQTRDRAAPVERFQNDDQCKLFLISLKAGGLGLNLTAAEYVFLLDPWWNPAVEAQAIDRAHRIGQTRQVFAYRLIAKDTVEEKVLQLQQTKRDLADAIISADNSLIGKLNRDDLELLLS